MSFTPRRRVVITGLGTVNPIALNVPDYWRGLLAGASGIAPITLFDTTAYKVRFGGEVKNFRPETLIDSKTVRRLDRFSQFALFAAAEAIAESGIDFSKEDPFRCGCILGSGIGGMAEFEEGHTTLMTKGPSRLSPFVIPKMIANAAAGNISIRYHLMGPNTTVSTACSSAAHALGDAMHQIAYGFADVIVSGGTEAAITPMGLRALDWRSIRIIESSAHLSSFKSPLANTSRRRLFSLVGSLCAGRIIHCCDPSANVPS